MLWNSSVVVHRPQYMNVAPLMKLLQRKGWGGGDPTDILQRVKFAQSSILVAHPVPLRPRISYI